MEDEEYYRIIKPIVERFYLFTEREWHKHGEGGIMCCKKCKTAPPVAHLCSVINCPEVNNKTTYLIPLPESRVSVYLCATCLGVWYSSPIGRCVNPIPHRPLTPAQYQKYKDL